MSKRVVVTGGGTGGHLYPALAIIESIKDCCEIVYVGNPDKIEAKVVPQLGLSFLGIKSFPFSKNIITNFKVLNSILKAIGVVKNLKPDLIIGVGGYVSLPIMLAGTLLRIPVLIHEQNVFPGIANRLLLKLGVPIMLSFEATVKLINLKRYFITGCPVRESIGNTSRNDARRTLGLNSDNKILLIFGGSGGSKKINEVGLHLIKEFAKSSNVFIVLITGKYYYSETLNNIQALDNTANNFRVIDYSNEIDLFLTASDLVICRSGSSTINELLCSGTPSVLIPSPNVSENHQEANARLVEEIGGGVVVLENEISINFHNTISSIINNKERLEDMKIKCLSHCLGKTAKVKVRKVIFSKLNIDDQGYSK